MQTISDTLTAWYSFAFLIAPPPFDLILFLAPFWAPIVASALVAKIWP